MPSKTQNRNKGLGKQLPSLNIRSTTGGRSRIKKRRWGTVRAKIIGLHYWGPVQYKKRHLGDCPRVNNWSTGVGPVTPLSFLSVSLPRSCSAVAWPFMSFPSPVFGPILWTCFVGLHRFPGGCLSRPPKACKSRPALTADQCRLRKSMRYGVSGPPAKRWVHSSHCPRRLAIAHPTAVPAASPTQAPDACCFLVGAWPWAAFVLLSPSEIALDLRASRPGPPAAHPGRAPPCRIRAWRCTSLPLLLLTAACALALPALIPSMFALLRFKVHTFQAPPAFVKGQIRQALLFPFKQSSKLGTQLSIRLLPSALGNSGFCCPACCSTGKRANTLPRSKRDVRASCSWMCVIPCLARRLVHLGELSSARQALAAATLAELRDPSRRPAAPYESLPPEVLRFQPAAPATLRWEAFLANLRRAKKGAAAGPSGLTAETARLVLDNEADSERFCKVAQLLARALRKPSGRVRG